MGSPNFGGNSKGIDVPMYAVEYTEYDEMEHGILEEWLYENDITVDDVINGCGVNPLRVEYGQLDDLSEWSYENGYGDPLEFARLATDMNMEADFENGRRALDSVNDMLDTDMLYVEIKNGYWNGYCVLTESPYWDSKINDINYEWIADDYEVSIDDAHKLFDKQIDIANRMLKSEFGGIGWRPHSGGYTGSFYEL